VPRLLLLLAALLTLPCGHAAAQASGQLRVGITILEPVSTDRSGPATIRRTGGALDVALPASSAVAPLVSVTMERGGRVAECRPRTGGAGAPTRGRHHAACPLPRDGEPARIRMVVVPAS
jgi:hypothetical protein